MALCNSWLLNVPEEVFEGLCKVSIPLEPPHRPRRCLEMLVSNFHAEKKDTQLNARLIQSGSSDGILKLERTV